MILVIEDNQANLDLMSYLLRTFGYEVDTATDGEAGVERAIAGKPELVVCDMQLPKLDGFGVIDRLRNEPALEGVPILAVSALAMVGDRDRILAAGFDGYIAKPIKPETFVEQLEAYIPKESRVRERPVCHPFTDQLPAPAHGNEGQGRPSVLVVDDDPQNRAVMKSLLEPSGFDVRVAETSDDAWALLEAEKPDVIVCDFHIPHEEEFIFLRRVKASLSSDIPFIVISATTHCPKAVTEALERGAVRFLLRPIDPTLLLSEIRDCLGERPEGSGNRS